MSQVANRPNPGIWNAVREGRVSTSGIGQGVFATAVGATIGGPIGALLSILGVSTAAVTSLEYGASLGRPAIGK